MGLESSHSLQEVSDASRSLNDTDSCGIGLVHLEGLDTEKLQAYLWEKHRIMTTPIVHPEFTGLRITPNAYTMMSELDLFCEKVEESLRKGLPAFIPA